MTDQGDTRLGDRDPPAGTALTREIKDQAFALGFGAVGVATLEPSRHAAFLEWWLDRGYAGTMRYLHRQAARRKDPAIIVPGATRAVVVLDNYFPGPEAAAGESGVRIAKYAVGRDYHRELEERLSLLSETLLERGASIARPFADAGPVPERELAERAGLGWIGKNTMLIRPSMGSFFFIGSVFTDLDLVPDAPFRADHCGSCTRCIESCPTGAIVAPRVLDATRCISYLTIEYRGEIPGDLTAEMEGWAFGCDVCNDVCPWNVRFASPTTRGDYRDRGAIGRTDPEFFERMSEEAFAATFQDTPLERPGLIGMRRNYRAAFHSLRARTE